MPCLQVTAALLLLAVAVLHQSFPPISHSCNFAGFLLCCHVYAAGCNMPCDHIVAGWIEFSSTTVGQAHHDWVTWRAIMCDWSEAIVVRPGWSAECGTDAGTTRRSALPAQHLSDVRARAAHACSAGSHRQSERRRGLSCGRRGCMPAARGRPCCSPCSRPGMPVTRLSHTVKLQHAAHAEHHT